MKSRLSNVCGSLLICTLLVVSALCLDAAPSAATVVGERCPTAPTRDLSAPMRGFPPVRQVPASGYLPFGPAAQLFSLSGSVQAGSGPLGFSLLLHRKPALRWRLGWQMDLRVIKLDARGNERGLVAQRKTTLGLEQELGEEEAVVSAPVSDASAYFRLDVAIRKKNGVMLGRYSEYVRVLPARIDAKLLLSANVVEPNDPILSRIQNRGSVAIAYEPEQLRLERRTKTGWTGVQEETSSPWWPPVARAELVPGGSLGSCTGRRIPSGAAPGTYRLSERFSAAKHPYPLHAEFQVRSKSAAVIEAPGGR